MKILQICPLSVSSDLTVLGVLVLCVCLYIPGLVLCKRADVISEANQRVHYLPDNSPRDPYLYAVTIYTGPCSAACMSAKVRLFVSVHKTVILHASDGGCMDGLIEYYRSKYDILFIQFSSFITTRM